MGWVDKFEGWINKLEGWVAKLEGWVAEVRGMDAGGVPTFPQQAVWVRIQPSIKNHKRATKAKEWPEK